MIKASSAGFDTTKAALAALIVEQGIEQGRLIEIGPQHIGDVDFGVGELPQQEIADAPLATGADQQIRIALTSGVQLGGKLLLIDCGRI